MRDVKFEEDVIYHVFNRGVDKRDIFNSESDMWRFLQGMFLFNDKNSSFGIIRNIERENNGKLNFILLKEFVVKNKNDRKPLVRIMADCLMPNHFHLIIQEIEKGGISKFMHKLSTGYTKYFNKKYGRDGSLFQSSFKVVPVKNDLYLQYLLIYVNIINPGQIIEPKLKEKGAENIEKILNFAKKYSFCTNPDYLGERESIIIDKGILGYIFNDSQKYEEFARDTLLSKKCDLVFNLFLE